MTSGATVLVRPLARRESVVQNTVIIINELVRRGYTAATRHF